MHTYDSKKNAKIFEKILNTEKDAKIAYIQIFFSQKCLFSINRKVGTYRWLFRKFSCSKKVLQIGRSFIPKLSVVIFQTMIYFEITLSAYPYLYQYKWNINLNLWIYVGLKWVSWIKLQNPNVRPTIPN